jgi:lambda family phage portal protein
MKILRNIISAIAYIFLGRYEAATYSPTRSRINSPYQGARFDISGSTRSELARKARYFEQNNGIVNRMVDLFECYVVGPQLQVMPTSSDPQWNAKAKLSIDQFARYCDLTSLSGLSTCFSLVARTWFIDGEVFILLTSGSGNRPRIQIIEGHRVATPPAIADQEGRTVVDGVKIDANGRPVGYYIGQEMPDGRIAFGEATPAESVIHVFEPSRPGQYRGITMLYPVLNELHDLDDLHILEMTAAKDAAAITNVVKNQTGEMDPAKLLRQRFTQGQTTNTGAATSVPKSDYYQEVLGSRTVVLSRGDDVQQFRSDRPSVVTVDYWRYKTELVCAGVGIPYVIVFPDSMQGTVYRGALDMANSFFKARHGVIAEAVRRVIEHYLKWARNVDKNLQDPPSDWANVTIYPPRAVNVDVGRNSAAMLSELEAGATNYELIYAPLGLDWREQFRKLAEQRQFAASLGLDLQTAAAGGTPDQSQEADPMDEPMPIPIKQDPTKYQDQD